MNCANSFEIRRSQLVFYILIIVLLSSALRFVSLDRMALWGDEACMVYLCDQPVAKIVQILASEERPDVDVAPPLYFVLLHGWMKLFGESVKAFRGYSVLFGILTVMGAIWLGTVILNRTTGLLLGLLTAINPMQIWYSQEGRMYSMAAFLSTVTLVYVGKIRKKPELLRNWVLFWTVSSALVYTQYYGFLLIGSVTVFSILDMKNHKGEKRKIFINRWLLTLFIWSLVFLPWLPVLFRDYTHASAPGGFPINFHPVKSPVFLFFKMTIFGNYNYVIDHLWLYIFASFVLIIPILFAFKHFRKFGVQLSLFTVLLPFLVVYLGSLIGMRIYKSHPFIIFQVPLLFLIAVGILNSSKKIAILLMVILIGMNVYVMGTLCLAGLYVKPRVHDVIAWIETRISPEDQIAVVPAFLPNPLPIVGDLLAFKYHSKDSFNSLYLTGDNANDLYSNVKQAMQENTSLFLVYQDNRHIRLELTQLKNQLLTTYDEVSEQTFPSGIRGFSMRAVYYNPKVTNQNN